MKAPKPIGPIVALANNSVAAKFWFTISVLFLIGWIFDRFQIISAYKATERVVILDESETFHVSPVRKFKDASELHTYLASLATDAYLMRNPNGPDNPDLLRLMFLDSAYTDALSQIKEAARLFQDKQIHQKVSGQSYQIAQTSEDQVKVLVSGQLIRIGTFNNAPFVDGTIGFQLELTLVRNPNLQYNGRLPLAVFKYQYREFPILNNQQVTNTPNTP